MDWCYLPWAGESDGTGALVAVFCLGALAGAADARAATFTAVVTVLAGVASRTQAHVAALVAGFLRRQR